ncbi:Translation initiation factor IF-2 [Penicillium taxi]|uniref:Translation initiation factor IF-2 n=1 Tax=Penicillium taxi TaxID=168475 RepID=UPI002544F887|nr:Translation initiation factor IF-2 [Penicillium taxi]KAJ5908977.1 Translation initiation factor IF-2 [Penicillium taxi]
MYRRAVFRIPRPRVDIYSTGFPALTPTRSSLRTFRSYTIRLDSEDGNGNGNGSALTSPAFAPKFGNRWGGKAKPITLSAAEQALRDNIPTGRFVSKWGAKQSSNGSGLTAAEQTLRDALVAREKNPTPKATTPQAPRPGRDLDSTLTPRQERRKEFLRKSVSQRQGWECGECKATVWRKNDTCPFCKTKKPNATHEPTVYETRVMNWDCTECNTYNMARRTECKGCGGPRPDTAHAHLQKPRRNSEQSDKFRKLGQTILAEEEPARRNSTTQNKDRQNVKKELDSSESNTVKAKQDSEAQATKNKEDLWAWDMSSLDKLASLEEEEPTVPQKKRRDGRKPLQSASQETDFDPEEHKRRRDERKRNKKSRQKVEESAPAPLYLPEFISVTNLADVIGVRTNQFIQRMEEMGFDDVGYNHVLDAETAGLVAAEFNFEAIFDTGVDDLEAAPVREDRSGLPTRPPVVTIMGHVDHGKTTILDWLRKSSIAAGEHGGITQHIGAFSVAMPSGKTITFLDTPGHSAFLEMRRRGADVTDIVVLVVASDDSVKPQTIEAIKHATQANVPIIVAISKIDKEGRNPDKVKQDLSVHGVHVEDYGGDVQAIGVSGKTGQGMLELEESILALSDMLDNRADDTCNAEGWVLEATTKSYGRVASALIRHGTLRPGDVIVAGNTWARVRTLRNEAGVVISEATPGMPVEIDGWKDQPTAGSEILQAPNEQKAKDVVDYRKSKSDTRKLSEDMVAINEARRETEKRKTEDLDSDEASAAPTQPTGPQAVNFIIKADVDGSAEAVLNSVAAIGNNEVYANIIRSGVGPITEFDVDHAASSNGRIISFNMSIEPNMSRMAEQEGVKIMDHNIIYKLIDDVKAVMSEQLAPTITQRVTGEAEIQQIFEITVKGRQKSAIAGCRVRNGLINKSKKVRVIRRNETVYDGLITSLKNVKKDVTEMRKDTECGINFENWDGFAVGDHVQCYEEIHEQRSL